MALRWFSPQQKDLPRRLRGFLADLGYSLKEEQKNMPPSSSFLITDGLEMVVVFLAMPFEEMREVQYRLGQYVLFAEQEGDQESPDAAVAVQEGVDCLELGMGEADLYEEGETLDGVQGIDSRARAPTAAPRAAVGRTWPPPSVQPPAPIQFWLRRNSPGASRLATNLPYQVLMDLAEKTNRDRQLGQAREPVVHCAT